MKERIEITCTECDAEYIVEHDLDPKSYRPTNCLFCGEELDDEYVNPVDIEEDEEESMDDEDD